MPVFLKLFQKVEDLMLPNYVYKASITLTPKPDKDTIRKFRSMSVININARFLNKIIANGIEPHSILIYHNFVFHSYSYLQ